MPNIVFGLLILCSYFIVCASIAILFRKMIKIPDEIFRKTLHFILLGSVIPLVFAFEKWWYSSIICIAFIIIVYPILMFFERFKTYSEIVTERKKGELKTSLILVFLMISAVISICWGAFKDNVLVLIVIYSWGIGDAFAALIGKRFGKVKIYKKKSLEGTLTMAITTFAVVASIFVIRGSLAWYAIAVIAVAVGVVEAVVELYTPNGLDTVTCPLASLAVMLPLLYAFGGLAI